MADKKEILSKDCPAPLGPYSAGLLSKDLFFTTQLGLTPLGALVSDDAAGQAEQCMKNIGAIIGEAGGTMDDIIKCNVYLADMDDFVPVNDVYKNYFTKPYPGRTCLQAAKLPADAKVEIEIIARIG